MSHTIRNKASLLARVRRIRGQVEALERALEAEKGCAEIMQQIAAFRGAANGHDANALDQGHGESHEHNEGHDHAWEWAETLRIGLVAVAAAAVWWRLWEPFPAISLIGMLGLAIGGWPIFKEAVENLVAKRM